MSRRSADIDFVISVCDSKYGTSIDAEWRIAKKKRGCSFFVAVASRFILKVEKLQCRPQRFEDTCGCRGNSPLICLN